MNNEKTATKIVIQLSDEQKDKLKKDKSELSKQMRAINDELGIKTAHNWKYHLPKSPRKGKYAKVLTNKDKRVCFENILYRLDKALFVTYLSVQKKDMGLDNWTEKYLLDDKQMVQAKKFI